MQGEEHELLRDVSTASNSYSRDDRHVLDIIDKVSLHTPQEYLGIIIIGDELGQGELCTRSIPS